MGVDRDELLQPGRRHGRTTRVSWSEGRPRALQMPRRAPQRGERDVLVKLHKERLEKYDPLGSTAFRTPSKGKNTHTASDFNAVYYFITVFKRCQVFFQNFFLILQFYTKCTCATCGGALNRGRLKHA